MPFQLLLGQLPILPGVLQRQPPVAYSACDTYVKELEAMLQSSYAMAHKVWKHQKLIINASMTTIQGVTGGTDQTSGGCSLC